MSPQRIPSAVYLLALAIFAQGTSELIASGLLPEIAEDLSVSIPQAGWLTSGFAIGMAVGAPVLAVVTLRWPRRATLLGLLLAFVASHVVGALAPDFGLLLGSRVVGAVVYAGFWAVASVTVLDLVPVERKGKALSVLVGGLTIASIVGVPAGTWIGQQFGWRATLWTVVVATLLAGAGLWARLPVDRAATRPRPRLGAELRVVTNPRLWIAYLATAMSAGASVATFTYAAALLVEVSGFTAAAIPLVLLAAGLGGLAGVTTGGRTADRAPFATLVVGFVGVTAAAVAIAVGAASPVIAVVALVALLGFGFVTNPAVNVRVFTLAAAAPTLAGGTNVAAFNVGITLGPWLAGLLIASGAGLAAAAWVSAGMALIGLAATGWSAALRHRDPVVEPSREVVPVGQAGRDASQAAV